METKLYEGWDAVPANLDWRSATPTGRDVFHERAWLEAFGTLGVDAGDRFRLYCVSDAINLEALFPALVSRLYPQHPKSRVLHLLHREGGPYQPILFKDETRLGVVLDSLLAAIASERLSCDVIRVSPIDPRAPFASELTAAMARHGWAIQRYRHLAERHEDTSRMDAGGYLGSRPKAAMQSLRATTEPLFAAGRARFALYSEPEEVPAASRAYSSVLDTNHDEAERENPYYVPRLMRIAAEAGTLRVGVVEVDNEPAAVQVWVISGGVARCLRIWSDPGHSALPLDDAIIAHMAPRLLDADRVREINLGPVEEGLARCWAPRMHERIGVVAFNRRTARGLRGVARHIVLPRALSIPRRVWRRIRPRG